MFTSLDANDIYKNTLVIGIYVQTVEGRYYYTYHLLLVHTIKIAHFVVCWNVLDVRPSTGVVFPP